VLSDNRIVHGLWIGPLSRLERLTMHSFVGHGHEFHLWRYGVAPDRLPRGVVVRDANEILPSAAVFRKLEADKELELGAGSYATFSDLFRAQLLHKLGGIWVDMDVLCLRPFDFAQPYVFRAHRLGVVMNVIKCPPGSRLMGDLVAGMSGRIGENSSWFDFTLAFKDAIHGHHLQDFIRDDLMPRDRWETVQPFLEGDGDFPPSWYALHWNNELWKTLRRTGGLYKGRRLTLRPPDNNHPIPGTRLFRLYQQHGLLRPGWRPCPPPVAPINRRATEQPQTHSFPDILHLNVALPGMNLGGAERLVHDLVSGLQTTAVTSKLFLLHDAPLGYGTDGIVGCEVVRLEGQPSPARMQTIASKTLSSNTPAVFTHMLRVADLEILARSGARVVPVIHNSQPGWQDPPQAFDRLDAPFLVAVSQAVKDQLLALGCCTPIVVVRHEVWRPRPSAQDAEAERLTIRRRHGVPDDMLLIGMVGQFKAQKAYTRAVRVLHKVQERAPARLMIVGDWDHAWGSGRAAYTATCRQALELGVMPDLIMPGAIQPVEPYYSAFDVFLSTSVYEGLSIAMLEAQARGCPVVTADAGGNAEALGPTDRLIEDATDAEVCARAIWDASGEKRRVLRPPPPDASLVPRLWALLGRYGAPAPAPRSATPPFTLVLTENLNIGGPQRSLANLLARWRRPRSIAVAVLEPLLSPDFYYRIEDAGIEVFGLETARTTMERCEHVLRLVERLGATTLAFWNVPAPLKFALAKVLEVHPLRLIDVSPGPMLRDELMAAAADSRRLSLSLSEYFARLDCFVSKYRDGLPPELYDALPSKARVIPNGVPLPDAGTTGPLSRGRARLAIGACCRIVPSKRLELLVDAMDILAERLPEATLTIVGAADPWHADHAAFIADKIGRAGLGNIRFVGAHADVGPFLRDFSVFVMLSDDQGCPNASLEAMAAGLPVVANNSGGVGEQVIDGVNGFLLPADDPAEIAAALRTLLLDPELRASFGAAARRHVERTFSMERMVAGYEEAFGCESAKTRMAGGRDAAASEPGMSHEDQDQPS
jgi:glycosyltransferase involved in cell wall biosynthesis